MTPYITILDALSGLHAAALNIDGDAYFQTEPSKHVLQQLREAIGVAGNAIHAARSGTGLTETSVGLVETVFWAKPVPYRDDDWQATHTNYDPESRLYGKVGHGATEEEAIADLVDQMEPA